MEEKKYCPTCGAPNDIENRFCGSCGADLDVIKAQEAYKATPTPIQPTAQQPAQVVYVPVQQPKKQQITVLGMFGMILGIVSFLILTWVSLFVVLWMPFLFLGLTILGIIFSAISVRDNIAIGITGLITGILGGMAQIGWCIFVLIIWTFGF